MTAKFTSNCLRLCKLSVAGLLATVVADRAAAQGAPTTQQVVQANPSAETTGREAPEAAANDVMLDQDTATAGQDAGRADESISVPAIEVMQPDETRPDPDPASEPVMDERVVAVQPRRYQPAPYSGRNQGMAGAGGAGGEAAGQADAEGQGHGAGESVWGPVDGFVATRSVSGIKTDTPIIEIPQSVSVITADRIEQLGANSLPQALSYTAGITPNAFGFDGRFDWLRIRGFNAFFPGFYFDGLFARNNNTWAAWKVEPYGAERIEVLKGPASVLYGQMNPGGTINVITKRPTEETFYEVGMEVGNFGRLQPFFDFGGPATESDNVLYRVTGLGLKTDTHIDFVEEDRFYFAPALTLKPSEDLTFTLLGHYMERDTGTTSNFLPPEGTLLPNRNGQIRRSFHSGDPTFDTFAPVQKAISYFLDYQVNETWELRQNARYGNLSVEYDTLYGVGIDPFDVTQRTLNRRAFFSSENVDQFVVDNQAEANFVTGAIEHTMLFGVDYQWNDFARRTGDGPTAPLDIFSPTYGEIVFDRPPVYNLSDTVLTQTGIYAQEQAKIFDRLILVAGARYDWAKIEIDDHLFGNDTEQNDEAFSWRTGVVYETPGGIAPYFSYSTSFLPVSGVDPLTGNPFDPETSRQYEVGVKIQPTGRESLMTFSAFDIRRQGYLTFDNLFIPRQTGEVLSRGLEFEAVAELTDGLDFIAAYTWLPDFTITKTSNPAELNKRDAAVPEHWGSLWAHYTFQRGALEGFGFGGGVRYIGESFGDTINSDLMVVPSVTLFDAAIDYTSDRWRLALNVHNIGDELYVATCDGSCYYGEPRTVVGTIARRW